MNSESVGLVTIIGATTISQLAEKTYYTKDSISMANCRFFIFTVYAGGAGTSVATRTGICIPGDVFKHGYYHDCSWVNSQNKQAWVGVQWAANTAIKVKGGGSDIMVANAFSFSLHGFYLVNELPV